MISLLIFVQNNSNVILILTLNENDKVKILYKKKYP